MTKYAIFDLAGTVAFFDEAKSAEDAVERLARDDDSYADGVDIDRVHALDEGEAKLLAEWIEGGQVTGEWPFDWRAQA